MATEGQGPQGPQTQQPNPAVVLEMAQRQAGQMPQPPIQPAPVQLAASVEKEGTVHISRMIIGDNPDTIDFLAKLAEDRGFDEYAARLRGRRTPKSLLAKVGDFFMHKRVEVAIKVVFWAGIAWVVYEGLAYAFDWNLRAGLFGQRGASNQTVAVTPIRRSAA